MQDISKMTRKEFDAVPLRNWNDDIGPFRSMVILPGRIKDMHDSGYRAMDFVAVDDKDKPICRLSGCSDVIDIEGIGGLGKDWYKTPADKRHVPNTGWIIDCLPKSGLLRIFSGRGNMTVGPALSSFEIYSEKSD